MRRFGERGKTAAAGIVLAALRLALLETGSFSLCYETSKPTRVCTAVERGGNRRFLRVLYFVHVIVVVVECVLLLLSSL